MRDLRDVREAVLIENAEAASGSERSRILSPLVSASLKPTHRHLMRGGLAFGDEVVFGAEVGKHLGLGLGSVDAEIEEVNQVTFIDYAIAAPGSVQGLLHAGHDVVAGLFALVVFFGDLILANLLKQLLVLVDEEIHLPDGTVNVVLGAFDMAVDL